MDLKNLGIEILHSNAFAGTSDLTILLQGNSIFKMFPDAFPVGVVRGENCSDFVGWSVSCLTFESELTCDQTTCSTESPYLATDLGVDAVDACCILGGGHRGGANLIMDETSSITCRPSNSSSEDITCKCSVGTERYNVESHQCVSSCLPGELWVEQNTGFDIIATKTRKGRCVSCPFGKSSEVGSWECFDCDFMFRLSQNCDVPVTGILLIFSILIIVVVASLLFRRYKKKQDRIKQNLRLDLHRQKQLVKTKQTDIKLMTGTYLFFFLRFVFAHELTTSKTTGAWKLSPEEVKLEDKIASGAYGEVWKGALHDRWIVAIKKLFPQSGSSSNVSSVSSVSKKRRNSLELFKDQEIRFLIRTWCPRARDVLALYHSSHPLTQRTHSCHQHNTLPYPSFAIISIERLHFF